MGLEVRQLVVKSTVTREPARAPEELAHTQDLRMLREEILEESRRLVVQARDTGRER